jgi:hypothetical protein
VPGGTSEVGNAVQNSVAYSIEVTHIGAALIVKADVSRIRGTVRIHFSDERELDSSVDQCLQLAKKRPAWPTRAGI